MRNRVFALLLAAIVLLGACAAPGSTAEPSGGSEQSESAAESTAEAAEQKNFTLMVYMIGSDLEASAAAASNDLAEMTENHPDLEAVNVLVYTGGSPAWHSDVPEEANAVMELTAQGFSTLETYPEQSMGQPDSLTRFLNYGVEHFPAEQYGLILWDHGNGPVMGYGKDLRFDGDALTLPEAENYASGGYFILRRLGEETYQAVYYSEDVEEEDGLLTASFGGQIPYLVDLTTGEKAIVPMRQWDVVDGVARYTAGGTLEMSDWMSEQSYQWACMHLNGDGEKLWITGIYESDAGKTDLLQGKTLTTGKQEEADLSEWNILMVSSIQGHYLTRSEDGILADYWEWPEDHSIISWNNYPIENGFEFQYLPLYEDGDEYYVMFRLTDVQGNLYSSELLPAALEQEPEWDDECVQLQWDGDGTLCHQENGISVYSNATPADIEGGGRIVVATQRN